MGTLVSHPENSSLLVKGSNSLFEDFDGVPLYLVAMSVRCLTSNVCTLAITFVFEQGHAQKVILSHGHTKSLWYWLWVPSLGMIY